jgi:hypothetical protein
MHTNRNLLRLSVLGIARRAAAFSFLMAGTASLMQAQQTSSAPPAASAPLLLAVGATPVGLASAPDTSSSSVSSSSSSLASDTLANDPSSLGSAADGLSQPPPRRRYGRPNYADSHTNADGSNKFAFMGGAGLTSPVANSGIYLTPNYVFQVGAGRNWSKKFGVLVQFDYNHFGFQGSTLANQQIVENNFIAAYNLANPGADIPALSGLDGTSHVWSFTFDPTFTFYSSETYGVYAIGGVGFYHKTANFFVPSTQEACSVYGCFSYAANQTVDDYTSNAPGFNGGLGITYKPSRFSGERFYLEGRFVYVDNSTRAASSTNLYPPNANQTYYVPATFGLRF